MVVANRFLGFGLEVLERGCEIVAASRGILVGGMFRSDTFGRLVFTSAVFMSVAFTSVAFMNVVFMNFRGGSQWFRRGGLCVLGSVDHGRGAGVGVVFRCHGFKTGFKIAGVAVVEQVHSLCVDAIMRASCGTWSSGLLAWSLGCVEADLADDPRTIPAGSKPRPIGTLRL